ncbi:MAG: hypothetical protein KJZ96_17630 [Rhodocyclaceae bacterium]|nr:hypothetical protein [Rhodocyclaceae bacterium]
MSRIENVCRDLPSDGARALRGDKAPNPADEVGTSSIATFVAKDRALSPSEIRVMHRVLDAPATVITTERRGWVSGHVVPHRA